jgi:hypothetical protein
MRTPEVGARGEGAGRQPGGVDARSGYGRRFWRPHLTELTDTDGRTDLWRTWREGARRAKRRGSGTDLAEQRLPAISRKHEVLCALSVGHSQCR